jgi:hypothetical protein
MLSGTQLHRYVAMLPTSSNQQNSLFRPKPACKLTGVWERSTHSAVREASRVHCGKAGCRVSSDAQARRGRQPHGLLRALRRAAVQRIQQAASLPRPQDDLGLESQKKTMKIPHWR